MSEMGGAERPDLRGLPLHPDHLLHADVARLRLLRLRSGPSGSRAVAPMGVHGDRRQPLPRLHSR